MRIYRMPFDSQIRRQPSRTTSAYKTLSAQDAQVEASLAVWALCVKVDYFGFACHTSNENFTNGHRMIRRRKRGG